jgi:hypothetical protein
MLTAIFWNTNQQPIGATIARLARRHDVDILILAECAVPPRTMLQALNRDKTRLRLAFGECPRIVVYSRFPDSILFPKLETDRLTIRRLSLPGRPEILLAAVHLPSKLYWSRESQSAECAVIANHIREVEAEVGHCRTILVGDLNMNPFEPGIVQANGFNAVMTRAIASRLQRTVQGKTYPFFYNPMWGCFGDGSPGPPGSYYFESSEHVSYYWNMFDQVLIRPELLPFFRGDGVSILDSDGENSLVDDQGRPEPTGPSDHLPILFRLDL